MMQTRIAGSIKFCAACILFALPAFLVFHSSYSLACDHANVAGQTTRMGEICTTRDTIEWKAILLSDTRAKHEIKNIGTSPTTFHWRKPGLMVDAYDLLDPKCVAYRKDYGPSNDHFTLDNVAPIEIRRGGQEHPAEAFTKTRGSPGTSAEIRCDHTNQTASGTLEIHTDSGNYILRLTVSNGTSIALSASSFSLSESEIMLATDGADLIFGSTTDVLATGLLQYSLDELNTLVSRDMSNDSIFILDGQSNYIIPLTSNIISASPLFLSNRSASLHIAVSIRP